MASLPPPPINDKPGSFTWLEWYRQLRDYISTSGSVPWNIIDFSGSSIEDIADTDHNKIDNLQGGTAGEKYHLTAAQHAALSSGAHNDLTGLQGGTTAQYYHLTSAQHTDLLDGGDSTLHYHAADRLVSNHSGTMANFDTACTDGNFAYQSQPALHTEVRSTTTYLNNVTVYNSNANVTLTAAQLIAGIVTGTPSGNLDFTLPTAANMDAAFSSLQTDQAFYWSLINLAASNSIDLLDNTNHTVVGNRKVSQTVSAQFLTRKTSTTPTYVTYRAS